MAMPIFKKIGTLLSIQETIFCAKGDSSKIRAPSCKQEALFSKIPSSANSKK